MILCRRGYGIPLAACQSRAVEWRCRTEVATKKTPGILESVSRQSYRESRSMSLPCPFLKKKRVRLYTYMYFGSMSYRVRVAQYDIRFDSRGSDLSYHGPCIKASSQLRDKRIDPNIQTIYVFTHPMRSCHTRWIRKIQSLNINHRESIRAPTPANQPRSSQ